MAIKDFQVNENRDREDDRRREEENRSRQASAESDSRQDKGGGRTEVKNAHATGDGSYGRNETGVPEDYDEEKGRDSVY